eukprot:303151-Chlamydomonas_euryale.AAC.4
MLSTLPSRHHSLTAATTTTRPPPIIFSVQCRAAHLDEGADQQEAVCQADLNAAEGRGDARAVGRQVGQVGRHILGRGNRCLQHAHERVAIDRLNNLGLRAGRQRQDARWSGRLFFHATGDIGRPRLAPFSRRFDGDACTSGSAAAAADADTRSPRRQLVLRGCKRISGAPPRSEPEPDPVRLLTATGPALVRPYLLLRGLDDHRAPGQRRAEHRPGGLAQRHSRLVGDGVHGGWFAECACTVQVAHGHEIGGDPERHHAGVGDVPT